MTQKSETRAILASLVDRLKVFKTPPSHYLTVNKYAKKIGMSSEAIGQAVRTGRIKNDECAAMFYKGQKILLINWNTTAYQYLLTCRKQPEDFKRNKDKTYKPIQEEGEGELLTIDAPQDNQSEEPGSLAYDAQGELADIGSAKLAYERLRVKKLEAEIQTIMDQMVAIEDVKAQNREVALSFKASFMAMATKISPSLAAERSASGCASILKKAYMECLNELKKLNGAE